MIKDILCGIMSGFTIFMFIMIIFSVINGKFTSYKDPKFEEVLFEYVGPLYNENDTNKLEGKGFIGRK